MTKGEQTFDPATHTYRIDGRPVPSVTQVLGDVLPGWQASEWYLERGRAVHACAAMIAKGQTFTHDPQIDGQVRALRRFFAEVKPLVLAVEQQVYSTSYRYAGTLDLLTRKPGGLQLMVVDFKASLAPATLYQCAAYALAYDDGPNAGRVPVNLGCGVEIRDDGTYKMSEVWNLKQYKPQWLALLTAYNIRRRCGVTETKVGEV